MSSLHSKTMDSSILSTQEQCEILHCNFHKIKNFTFLSLCTTLQWMVYGYDYEKNAWMQLDIPEMKDMNPLSNIRLCKLFHWSTHSQEHGKMDIPTVGAFIVSEASLEVDYTSSQSYSQASRLSEINQGDELTIVALNYGYTYRVPRPSAPVLDIQINENLAAVLCDNNEIMTYAISSNGIRTLQTYYANSSAMALGTRWLAYPARANMPTQEIESDIMDVNAALMANGLVNGYSSSPDNGSSSVTAIDVAQNVASGLYLLTKFSRDTIAPYVYAAAASALPSSLPNNSNGAYGHTDIRRRSESSNDNFAQSSSFDSSINSMSALNAHADGSDAGYVTIVDILMKKVLCTFKCHSTAIANLQFDGSGLLLATNSSKGQNIHLYRLLPPIQSVIANANNVSMSSRTHQLMYKLQRGITHARIQDITFSCDSKWLAITSENGTSHVFAIHPDGSRISPESHVNFVPDQQSFSKNANSSHCSSEYSNDVVDFMANYRHLEPKTLAQIVKLRHNIDDNQRAQNFDGNMSSSQYLSVSQSMTASSRHMLSRVNQLMEYSTQYLDLSSRLDHMMANNEVQDKDIYRLKSRKRIACLYGIDNTEKLWICVDGYIKAYDFTVSRSSQQLSLSPNEKSSKRRSSSSLGLQNSVQNIVHGSNFGVDVTVTLGNITDLMSPPAVENSFEPFIINLSKCLQKQSSDLLQPEVRTYVQRALPLWSHPKIAFRAIDNANPLGKLMSTKRKGVPFRKPKSSFDSTTSTSEESTSTETMFVLEMHDYFGVSASPVFHGQDIQSSRDPPSFELQETIHDAMHLSQAIENHEEALKNTHDLTDYKNNNMKSKDKIKSKKNKSHKKPAPENDPKNGKSNSPIQFLVQDTYFAAPKEKIN